MKIPVRRVVTATLFLTTMFSVSFAQQTSLEGQVVDAHGHAVAGAKVVVESTEFTSRVRINTGKEGNFHLGRLIPGHYSITVSAPGFATRKSQFAVPFSEPLIVVSLQPGTVAAEVSVTTTTLAGSPQSLTEVPGSIDRIDARTLDAARVFNFSEALRKLPGVNVRDEEGFGLRPNIGIRGTNPTRSTKVLLLEDGIPLAYAPYGDNASYYHPPIERYESIEVLKGSSQIAYGPQTIAGVINYLTPNPTQRPSFTIALTGGNRIVFQR